MKLTKTPIRARILLVSLVLVLVIGLMGAAVQPAGAAALTGTLRVVSVQPGQSVTIEATGLPATTPVTVRMSRFGTKAAGGMIVGTAVTTSGGYLYATYRIPIALKTQTKLALRVEATGVARDFLSTWFSNDSAGRSGTTSSGSSNTGTAAPSNIPSGSLSAGNITITDVDEDDSVTIKVTGAPGGAALSVWFDWKNRNGVMQGRQAGTVTANSSGNITATIDIPSAAWDRGSVRIRLEGANYRAYRWFLNGSDDDESGSSTDEDSSDGLPYIRVVEVEEDSTVTIKAFNFPKGDYEILMDEVGSGAKRGIEVDTVTIKQGTTFTGTFDIPEDLEGENEIAIRVQHEDESDIFAYTRFDNEEDN